VLSARRSKTEDEVMKRAMKQAMSLFVGVLPRDEAIQKSLRHPVGRRFENFPEPTLWPLDQFTMRRLQEGAITSVGEPSPNPAIQRRKHEE
jgi:hypothetical protein